jgi:hypothetical protein
MDKKQLRQYKSTFHFGVSVKYDFILKRGVNENDYQSAGWRNRCGREWKQKMVQTRIGVVVGWRWLSNGTICYGTESSETTYTSTQSIFAIEVKRGMMNKVDLVLPESLTPIHSFDIPRNNVIKRLYKDLPDRSIPTMSDKDKAWLRNEMKSVKRDSKGRWK